MERQGGEQQGHLHNSAWDNLCDTNLGPASSVAVGSYTYYFDQRLFRLQSMK